MSLKKLKNYLVNLLFGRYKKRRNPQISILIPFSSNNDTRQRSLHWLRKYWKHELPDAEVIIGRSYSPIFCKAEALNDAALRSRGKILVIMDADAYIGGNIIQKCADRILEEHGRANHLWYVPYRHLYRLTQAFTERILASDPKDPLRPPHPMLPEDLENNGDKSKYGHRYGAMCMIFPRKAYNILGCFDERFKGWGGEDVALLRALDTLYGKHKTIKTAIYHLWHPYIGADYKSRMWEGQDSASPNSNLANAYNRATRHPGRMRKLVDAGCEYGGYK